MLQFMAVMLVLNFLIRLPDYKAVRELRKNGWEGGLDDYYKWKNR